jgi:hypothetical protein
VAAPTVIPLGQRGRLILYKTGAPRTSTVPRSHFFSPSKSPVLIPHYLYKYLRARDGRNERTRASVPSPKPTSPKSSPAREFHGSQSFDLFPELPLEIRLMIWRRSFPDDRSILVRPIVAEDSHLQFSDGDKPRIRINFSYHDNNPIAALQTSSESRQLALSVYRSFVANKRIVYFYSARETLLFEGLDTIVQKLYSDGVSPPPGVLTNTLNDEASQLMAQYTDSALIRWSAPGLKGRVYNLRAPA